MWFGSRFLLACKMSLRLPPDVSEFSSSISSTISSKKPDDLDTALDSILSYGNFAGS